MKKSKIICTIPSSWTGLMSYTHSFGMTKNYIIFIEQPYCMGIAKAAFCIVKGQGYCFQDWLEWRPEHRNRFYIIDKESGKVVKSEFMSQDPFFFLHFINCYEDNNQIVIDINAYPNPSLLEEMTMSKLRSGHYCNGDESFTSSKPCAQRFVVPLVSGDLKDVPENINLVEVKSDAVAVRKGNQIILLPEVLTETGLEFPNINKNFQSRKYEYFWATGWNLLSAGSPGYFENSICKINIKKKESILWRDGNYHFPGEPYFIPNPKAGSAEEDDGVIISTVTDSRRNANDFLLFLDGKTMKELGRAQFKAHIPQQIHGMFLEKLL